MLSASLVGGSARAWFEFKLEWERKALVKRFCWWLVAARPGPDESIALLCCFVAFLH